MALYLKCPNCGLYFMDMFGEHIRHHIYTCPECSANAECITLKEYSDAPKELKWKGYGNT